MHLLTDAADAAVLSALLLMCVFLAPLSQAPVPFLPSWCPRSPLQLLHPSRRPLLPLKPPPPPPPPAGPRRAPTTPRRRRERWRRNADKRGSSGRGRSRSGWSRRTGTGESRGLAKEPRPAGANHAASCRMLREEAVARDAEERRRREEEARFMAEQQRLREEKEAQERARAEQEENERLQRQVGHRKALFRFIYPTSGPSLLLAPVILECSSRGVLLRKN